MATRDEQILIAWNEWEDITGADANDPDDFVAWALENKKLVPRMQDIRRVLRRQVTSKLETRRHVAQLLSRVHRKR